MLDTVLYVNNIMLLYSYYFLNEIKRCVNVWEYCMVNASSNIPPPPHKKIHLKYIQKNNMNYFFFFFFFSAFSV
jgi:hypothetical protein